MDEILNWTTAIGTLTAGFAALYVVIREQWEKWNNLARFEIKDPYVVCTEPEAVNPEEIDWEELRMQEEFVTELRASGEIGPSWKNRMSVRIPIKQTGGGPADEVECILKNAWKYDKETDSFISSDNIILVNLTWRHHSKDKVRQRFLKGVSRECKFGVYGTYNIDQGVNPAVLYLSTNEPSGDPVYDEISNVLWDGLWRFEIMLMGKNMEPLYKRIELKLSTGWDGEKKSYTEYLSVKSID